VKGFHLDENLLARLTFITSLPNHPALSPIILKNSMTLTICMGNRTAD